MNDLIASLQEKIKRLKTPKTSQQNNAGARGYNVAVTVITDLFSCILVGLGIGLFLQKVFHTSPLLTAFLVLLGGIAGLYSVIRFVINEDKRNTKC